jgi:outer membrane immunogenic protein
LDRHQKRSNVAALGDPFDRATPSIKNQWFDTLTGRIGYAVAPTWLIYGQGGAAFGHAKAEINGFIGPPFVNCFSCDFEASKTRTGWTAGGGVEWRFAQQWSAFLEGNWMDFGNDQKTIFASHFGPKGCDFGCTFNTKVTAATVLVGVNYRFW